jgi:hypothetical protein
MRTETRGAQVLRDKMGVRNGLYSPSYVVLIDAAQRKTKTHSTTLTK